ncbi:uncharacterized protein EI90DRAFT_2908898 [Cantharellus anzutake]|uniref:uncharacterized protein n=1 Tax=Cantharellus anzutake TaxID=1750568 RepID=UPI0019031581|nr:uncharacterized protein EI90DRAFT_2908898 [Cantharellus anzutake]KAF8338074.1 hypothetical protein EI90DRAFT_2908898 [Cantharellus anzutake]
MRERATPWMANIDWDNCENVSQMLTKEIHAYAQFISPTPEEHETRRLIVQLIRNAITGDFPDAQLFTFGSFETRLYLPTGDIDLVVMSSIMEQYSSIKLLLSKLASSIRRARISHDVEIIAKAKVPIIKFVTSYGHISVDISVNRPGGVAASTMAKQFMEEIPAIRPLVLVIKNFLKQRNMNEVFSGGLGSYGILCLVTSFLQLHPKIRRSKIDPMDNLGVLLIEFFETYGKHFNYTDIGISLRNGGLYFRKRDRGWAAADRKSIGSILCIEDPRDPLNNVTSGSFAFHRVKQTFAGAFEVLTAELCLRDTERESKANGTYYSLRAEGSGDVGRSLLSGVTGITQEVEPLLPPRAQSDNLFFADDGSKERNH